MMSLHEKNEDQAVSSELPANIKDWNRDHVRRWMIKINVDKEDAEILYNQRIKGDSLLLLDSSDLTDLGLSFNAKKLIIHNRDQLKPNLATRSCSLKPYPFKRFDAAHRYQENSILDVTETGPVDLIQPCHEFKAFTDTTKETEMAKYTYEIIRFAAACMNSCTNGTIHLGVVDKPHGQILGVSVQDTGPFEEHQSKAIEKHFHKNHLQIAKKCIMPPRFVQVLKADMTSTGKYVIEVDIEPSHLICQNVYFNTYDVKKGNQGNDGKSFYVRDNSRSRNLINLSREYERHVAGMPKLSQSRKKAEEKHLSHVKNSVQGSKLCEMLTGGTQSLDKSHFTCYIVVANKSHPVQLENLSFLIHMDLTAVLDFDPESAENGLNTLFHDIKTNNHLPAEYKITCAVEDIIDKLKLTRNTSWVFCNGGYKEENPSDVQNWLTEKGSSVRDVVSLLCRADVLPNKKFLVIFLLFNQVSDGNDPLLETFSMFLQELKGKNQILSICDNETTYTYWKDLIKGRYGADISERCISELSFVEINGTVLSLWSENRKSSRFLPGFGGSKVVLSKKMEADLDMLSILCVNQCDGGNEDRREIEERFYRGGKVTWWNFYFSEQPGSMPFIKRDKFVYITDTIIPDLLNMKRSCVCFNISHLPGCGGTTLAMHVLWTCRFKFRCAVLKDKTDDFTDFTDVAQQVVQLLTFETKEQANRLPVLLMIDDFEDISDVKKLQQKIEEKCLEENIFAKSPKVIILNCMRAESCEQAEEAYPTAFIGNNLSDNEKSQFEEKLKEFQRTNTNTETFYGFMILKENFSPKYIQGVVKNTLKGYNFQHKHAQLFAVLVLLDVYCRNAVLSVSACETFLHLQITENFQTSQKVEDGFKNFSTLLTRCTVSSNLVFEGVRVIHSSISQHCLKELADTHHITKAEITNTLMITYQGDDCFLGKRRLMSDVRSMLLKRRGDLFSPLIHDIMKETPGLEETILQNAAKFYRKDAIIFQLLARYYYLRNKDKNFQMANIWAKKAKDHSKNNSYICDTVAQVLKGELKYKFQQDRHDPILPDSLEMYLTLAETASKACRETQQTARRETMARLQRPNDYNTYNTAGNLSELQVAVKVIEILQRTPMFNSDDQLLDQVLSGKRKIGHFAEKHAEHKAYSDVLQKHKLYLLDLKATMKQHFTFLYKFFINSGPFLAEKDKKKELTLDKTDECFQQYLRLFGEMNWNKLVNNNRISIMIKVEKTQQCLERNKADSYAGLLEYLYKQDSASTLEEIIQQYDFILKSEKVRNTEFTLNFIYANVILANINPNSKYIMPNEELFHLLKDTIQQQTSLNESLPLNYIAIVLLWQYANPELLTFVTQIRNSFSNEWKSIGKGRRAAIHFYQGVEKGYKGLISQRDLHSLLQPGHNITTEWDNEKTWQKVRDMGELHRASGRIHNNYILVDDSNMVVYPMFKCQLSRKFGTKLTFFIGFSMKGPVALDIDYES